MEFPSDLFAEEISDAFDPTPAPTLRYGPDSASIETVAEALLDAECPVIYAGQGVHYAQAWDSLKELAELLAAAVTTSLGGKSAFPEDHRLALGSGGRAIPKPVHHFLQKADLIFGIGCSFTRTNFGVKIPDGKRIIHATLDPADINKDVPVETALVGDAGLILDGLVEAVRDRSNGASEARMAAVTGEISAVKAEWLDQWKAKLTSDEAPMSPYRVIWDLLRHGRCQKHDCYARCGEPARPNVTLLAVCRAADLSRLGQDDAARLRSRARDGRQTCQARCALC